MRTVRGENIKLEMEIESEFFFVVIDDRYVIWMVRVFDGLLWITCWIMVPFYCQSLRSID